VDPKEIGLGVLCLALVTILGKVIFHLLKVNTNHLQHIQESINKLPCNVRAACPEDDLK